MSDYLNLLHDSLRSSYLQVEKIHNSLQSMEEGKYVNVRTGYAMKYRSSSTDYVYSFGRYPLCWNSEGIRNEYNPMIIEKLLNKYEDWLEAYENSGRDNDKISRLIKKEIERAKSEPDLDRKRKWDLIYKYDKHYDSYEEEEEEEEENSFIVNDDEVIQENGNKKKIFHKKLGKRTIYIDINKIIDYSNFDNSSEENTNINTKKVQLQKDNYDLYIDMESKPEINNMSDLNNSNFITTEDELKLTKKRRLRKNGEKIKNDLDFDDAEILINEDSDYENLSTKKRLLKNGLKVKNDSHSDFDFYISD